jgi:hypothetical protein
VGKVKIRAELKALRGGSAGPPPEFCGECGAPMAGAVCRCGWHHDAPPQARLDTPAPFTARIPSWSPDAEARGIAHGNPVGATDTGQPLVQPHQEVARFGPNTGQPLIQPQQKIDRSPGSIYDLPLEEEPAAAAPEQGHLMATLPDELADLKPSALRARAYAAGVPAAQIPDRPDPDFWNFGIRDRLIALIVAAEVGQAQETWSGKGHHRCAILLCPCLLVGR